MFPYQLSSEGQTWGGGVTWSFQPSLCDAAIRLEGITFWGSYRGGGNEFHTIAGTRLQLNLSKCSSASSLKKKKPEGLPVQESLTPSLETRLARFKPYRFPQAFFATQNSGFAYDCTHSA
jgi:hypothetical protein